MTEAVFYACLAGLLYFTVRFRQSQSWGSVIGAGLAACAGTLTRYEGWFLLPFVGAYFLWAAERRRVAVAAVFCLVAGLGPLFWLAHNWWLGGDPLAFYRGPYSARAIQGAAPYPGRGDWARAVLFFRTAVELCCGPGLVLVAMGGLAAALFKRAFWPLALLAFPGVFYLWSMHSGAVPVFVPSLWFGSYYNTRYGLAVLPLLALAAAGLVAATPPGRGRSAIAGLAIGAGSGRAGNRCAKPRSTWEPTTFAAPAFSPLSARSRRFTASWESCCAIRLRAIMVLPGMPPQRGRNWFFGSRGRWRSRAMRRRRPSSAPVVTGWRRAYW